MYMVPSYGGIVMKISVIGTTFVDIKGYPNNNKITPPSNSLFFNNKFK